MTNPFLNKKFISIPNFNMGNYKHGLYNRKAQPFLFHHNNKVFIYYEAYDNKKNWEIGVMATEEFPYGKWLNYPKILCKNNKEGHPDRSAIADPCVIYYDNKFHLWFDMWNKETTWTIGHAISDNGIYWVKQQTNGKTDILLSPSEDDWDNSFVHAPEVFLCNNELKFIYNAVPKGDPQKDYSAGLMKLSDPNNLNSSFIKLGRITNPNTFSLGRVSRLFAPFWYQDNLYAVLSVLKKGEITNNPSYFYFVESKNCGKTWQEVCQVPNNLWLHSFLIHNNKLYGINHFDQKLYYLEE